VFTNGVFDLLHVGHVWRCWKRRAPRRGAGSGREQRRVGARGWRRGPTAPLCPSGSGPACSPRSPACDCVVLFDEETPLVLIERSRRCAREGGGLCARPPSRRGPVEAWGGRGGTRAARPGASTTALLARLRGKLHDESAMKLLVATRNEGKIREIRDCYRSSVSADLPDGPVSSTATG